MISSSLGLYLALRPVRGVSSTTLAGFGCPTRSRALALTALVTENRPGLRFGTFESLPMPNPALATTSPLFEYG